MFVSGGFWTCCVKEKAEAALELNRTYVLLYDFYSHSTPVHFPLSVSASEAGARPLDENHSALPWPLLMQSFTYICARSWGAEREFLVADDRSKQQLSKHIILPRPRMRYRASNGLMFDAPQRITAARTIQDIENLNLLRHATDFQTPAERPHGLAATLLRRTLNGATATFKPAPHFICRPVGSFQPLVYKLWGRGAHNVRGTQIRR